MSRLTKVTLLLVSLPLVSLAAVVLLLTWSPADPLRFRLLHVPVHVNASTVSDTYTSIPPFEMELRNTSSFPIALQDINFEDRGRAAYQGAFIYARPPDMEEKVLSYAQVTIAGHETLRISYDPGPFAVPAMVADKPDIRYRWKLSILDKLESGLKDGLRKYGPEAWSGLLPGIELTTTLAPLDVSAFKPTPATP
ncbi:hypothetical protein [Roseimicrobium sp. ORNL1]|uniref:hypothetical protein n=1 Tax=Roseimicrobium sp. ORNL1 TaxID=2711231 RepID=UPI0013E0EFFA|nr:hypothetical protein [Roseimicrobium sp. ORNL1]QIF01959.1 hypothetical protein G5S37_10600 [Roseimicrobium sp. ORNL1]